MDRWSLTLLSFILLAGCVKQEVTKPDQIRPVSGISMSFSARDCGSSSIPEDMVYIDWLNETTLQVKANLPINCIYEANEIFGNFEISGDIIELTYDAPESDEIMFCLCNHDLSFTLYNLTKKNYTVLVKGPYGTYEPSDPFSVEVLSLYDPCLSFVELGSGMGNPEIIKNFELSEKFRPYGGLQYFCGEPLRYMVDECLEGSEGCLNGVIDDSSKIRSRELGIVNGTELLSCCRLACEKTVQFYNSCSEGTDDKKEILNCFRESINEEASRFTCD